MKFVIAFVFVAVFATSGWAAPRSLLSQFLGLEDDGTGSENALTSFPESLTATKSPRSFADLIDFVDEKILGYSHSEFTKRDIFHTTTTTTPAPPPTTTLPPTRPPTTTSPTPTIKTTKLPRTTTTNSSTTVEPDPHPNDNCIVRFLRKTAIFILEAFDKFLHLLHLGKFFGKLEEDAEYVVEKLIKALKKIFGILYA